MRLLSLKTIYRTYKHKKVVTHALNGIDLDIYEGEILVIMGPSGSGKSTLLNILAGIDKPTSGNFLYKDYEISNLSLNKMALYRQRVVGIIFQRRFNLLSRLSVNFNLHLPRLVSRVKENTLEFESVSLLLDLDLKNKTKRQVRSLSLGEQQRVAIARALMNDPEIILADEPTGNLDTKNGERIVDILKKLNEKMGKTVIIVTHNPEIAKAGDRIIHLKDGCIESIEVINDKSQNERLHEDGNILEEKKAKPFRLSVLLSLAFQMLWGDKFKFLIAISSTILGLALVVIMVDFANPAASVAPYTNPKLLNYEVVAPNQIVLSGEGKAYIGSNWSEHPDAKISVGKTVTTDMLAYIRTIPHVTAAYPEIPYNMTISSGNFFANSGVPVKDYNPTFNYLRYGHYFTSDTEDSIIIDEDIANKIAGGGDVRNVLGTYLPVTVSLREFPAENNISIQKSLKIVGIQNYSNAWVFAQVPSNFLNLASSTIFTSYPTVRLQVDDPKNAANVKEQLASLGYSPITLDDEATTNGSIVNIIVVVLGVLVTLAALSVIISIFNALIILIVKKSHVFASLVAIGVRHKDIRRYVLLQGVLIGLFVGVLAVIVGYLASDVLAENLFNAFIVIRTGVNIITVFTSSIGEMLAILITAVVLGVIESIYYAFRLASRSYLISLLRRE